MPTTIKSQSDYDNLGVGQSYIDTDGQTYTKTAPSAQPPTVLRNPQPTYQPNPFIDAGKSLTSGVIKGVEGGLGSVGDFQQGTGPILGFLGGRYLGWSPDLQDSVEEGTKNVLTLGGNVNAPTTRDVVAGMESQNPPGVKMANDYVPQTPYGQFFSDVGSFVPGALAIPDEGVTGAKLLTRAMIPTVAGDAASWAGQRYLGSKPGDPTDTALKTGAAILSGYGSEVPGFIPKAVGLSTGSKPGNIAAGIGVSAGLSNQAAQAFLQDGMPGLAKIAPAVAVIGAAKTYDALMKSKPVQAVASKLYGKTIPAQNALIAAMLLSGASAKARVTDAKDGSNQ